MEGEVQVHAGWFRTCDGNRNARTELRRRNTPGWIKSWLTLVPIGPESNHSSEENGLVHGTSLSLPGFNNGTNPPPLWPSAWDISTVCPVHSLTLMLHHLLPHHIRAPPGTPLIIALPV